MTERRKANVGDTIRLNGKNPAYPRGEHVINRVVDNHRTHPYGGTSTYWVGWNDDSADPIGSAWEAQFDLVEKFNKGDKVKLTPKDGGETVIYGEFFDRTPNYYRVQIGDTSRGHNAFHIYDWNIELVKPATEEILNALGESAYVAHRTNAEWSPYVKIEGQWHLLDDDYIAPDYVENVAGYIDREGFEIIFEGIKE